MEEGVQISSFYPYIKDCYYIYKNGIVKNIITNNIIKQKLKEMAI